MIVKMCIFVCYLHHSIDTSKLGLTPGIWGIKLKRIELDFIAFSSKLAYNYEASFYGSSRKMDQFICT